MTTAAEKPMQKDNSPFKRLEKKEEGA